MHCKFLDHGIAIGYDGVVKPCCVWQADSDWRGNNHMSGVDLVTWHQNSDLKAIRDQMAQDTWPTSCQRCESHESQGRFDSMRGNGNTAYHDYQDGDITLEIRPGAVCNFACQTCWPEASSRVVDFYHKAGLLSMTEIAKTGLDQFNFLEPVSSRIKNVVLLGGEPFYDPNCKKFLAWAQHHLTANIVMFTNGSQIDWTWLESYQRQITLVFSLDAIGKAAEYVRFGTDWGQVAANFGRARTIKNVEVRVNVTTSIYNYYYLDRTLRWLMPDWPAVVSFGTPGSISTKGIDQRTFDERLVPDVFRPNLRDRLTDLVTSLEQANIELGQKQNAMGAVQSIVDRLHKVPFDAVSFERWRVFVKQMDSAKRIRIDDHCPELSSLLRYQAH
jgi:sulfatase maturation enzyme AslB (radical SAM superfamily)